MGLGTFPSAGRASLEGLCSHVKREDGQIQSNRMVIGERINNAQKTAVGIKYLLRKTKVSIATITAQMIRARRLSGIARGSVIMKKANNKNAPLVILFKKTSGVQPSH